MHAIKIEYNGKVTSVPVTDNLILFNVNPLPDGRCLMDFVEFDVDAETKNIWYACDNLELNSKIHISIVDKDIIGKTEPVKYEPHKCKRQLTKLERFRLMEQQLKSEGWL